MRNWSERDAQALRDLEAKRNRAQSALDEDIAKLTRNCAERDVIRAFLREHGQSVLAMLIEHFEMPVKPSAMPTMQRVVICGGGGAAGGSSSFATTGGGAAGGSSSFATTGGGAAGTFHEGVPVANLIDGEEIKSIGPHIHG